MTTDDDNCDDGADASLEDEAAEDDDGIGDGEDDDDKYDDASSYRTEPSLLSRAALL